MLLRSAAQRMKAQLADQAKQKEHEVWTRVSWEEPLHRAVLEGAMLTLCGP